MASQISFSVLALALLLAVASADTQGEFVQFSYSGSHGPENWGSLSPSYAACSSGKSQSPINIVQDDTVQNKNLDELVRDYKPVNATLVNNGFNIGIQFESTCGGFSLDGKKYTMKRMHWHVPAEHQIDEEKYAAELHLVHQANDGTVSVVGVLFKEGDEDPFIKKFHDKLKELAQENCGGNEESHIALGSLETKHLRKSTRKYYRYVGSLTTPPCTENVNWYILGKVRSISKEQLEALKAPLDDAFKQNARPLQALNGRKVELYSQLD